MTVVKHSYLVLPRGSAPCSLQYNVRVIFPLPLLLLPQSPEKNSNGFGRLRPVRLELHALLMTELTFFHFRPKKNVCV